jgi:hypothetical protein
MGPLLVMFPPSVAPEGAQLGERTEDFGVGHSAR